MAAINIENLKKYAEQKFKKDLKGMENYKFIAKMETTTIPKDKKSNRIDRRKES